MKYFRHKSEGKYYFPLPWLAIVRDEANERDKVRVCCLLLQPLLHGSAHLLGQDLHQGLGRQLPHAVVLDGTTGQISTSVYNKQPSHSSAPQLTRIGDEGKLVEDSHDGRHLVQVVLALHHVLEGPEHGGVDLSVPLYLVPPCLDHLSQPSVIIHPLSNKTPHYTDCHYIYKLTETKLFWKPVGPNSLA